MPMPSARQRAMSRSRADCWSGVALAYRGTDDRAARAVASFGVDGVRVAVVVSVMVVLSRGVLPRGRDATTSPAPSHSAPPRVGLDRRRIATGQDFAWP